MKTHELAKALNALAKMLRSLPNQEIEDFAEIVEASKSTPPSDVGISLSTLAAFSNYSKRDWQGVIDDFEFPIQIRARDAGRDVMGKILSYLAENKNERDRVARKSGTINSPSSELSSALNFLLNNG